MDLRRLAKEAIARTRSAGPGLYHERDENENDWKEEIILQGQEIEGLNAMIVDLSRNNDELRAENELLRERIKLMRSELSFLDMAIDKRYHEKFCGKKFVKC